MVRCSAGLVLLAVVASSTACRGPAPKRADDGGSRASVDESFEVRITDYDGAYGSGVVYHARPGRLVATWFGDLEGDEDRELFRKELTSEEAETVRRSVQSLPLDELEDRYVDPLVADGDQLEFDIRAGGSQRRSIEVANVHQEDLARLVESIDGLLPPRFRIGYLSHASLPAEPGHVPLTRPGARLAPVAAFLDSYVRQRIVELFDSSSEDDEYDVAAEIRRLVSAFERSLTRAGVGPEERSKEARRLLEMATELYARAFVGDTFVPERYRHAREHFERILDRAQPEPPGGGER